MLLSSTVIENLIELCAKNTPEHSKELIENAAETLTRKSELECDNASQPLAYAIMVVLTEATKHGIDEYALKKQLEEHNLEPHVIEQLLQVYTKYRKDLIMRHMQIGAHFPQVTDMQWRIVKDIKSTATVSAEDAEELSFEITLGHYNKAGEFKSVVEFFANTEELQSMLSKLKDIERHCEKFANE